MPSGTLTLRTLLGWSDSYIKYCLLALADTFQEVIWISLF